MGLTVKGSAASGEQTKNMVLLCQIGRKMGAAADRLAGAMATMIQESEAVNMKGGDRDSAGLFQQRPSCGWGSYAQVTNPTYAIKKFMTPYLHYCNQGASVLDASNKVQGSAFPSAPGQWLSESRRNVQTILGSKDFGDATSSGIGGLGVAGGFSTKTETRTEPYEFTRGSSDQKEDSWTAMGRLAEEVKWDRFMRAGRLWFVSEDWLKTQLPKFVFAEGAQGVLSITHTSDARTLAAEATVKVIANRWSVLPGDVIRVNGEGPADGLWLVSTVHRTVTDKIVEIVLTRPTPKQAEPPNPTSTKTSTVGGVSNTLLKGSAIGGGASGGPAQAQAVYNAALDISNHKFPYVWGGGHGQCGIPSGGGFDCSGSVCAALGQAKLGYHRGGPVDVSGTIASNWGASGPGKYFTVWASVEHVWIQWRGMGRYWRFDTSPQGCGDLDGARMRTCARDTGSFTPRHWPGL